MLVQSTSVLRRSFKLGLIELEQHVYSDLIELFFCREHTCSLSNRRIQCFCRIQFFLPNSVFFVHVVKPLFRFPQVNVSGYGIMACVVYYEPHPSEMRVSDIDGITEYHDATPDRVAVVRV